MPDWNPDKEGHASHKWVVHNATQNRNFKEVVAADKVMKFNRENRFLISDEAMANEIRQEYPTDVTVTRMRYPHRSDRGHRYFFTVPEMPWKKKEEKETDIE